MYEAVSGDGSICTFLFFTTYTYLHPMMDPSLKHVCVPSQAILRQPSIVFHFNFCRYSPWNISVDLFDHETDGSALEVLETFKLLNHVQLWPEIDKAGAVIFHYRCSRRVVPRLRTLEVYLYYPLGEGGIERKRSVGRPHPKSSQPNDHKLFRTHDSTSRILFR